MTKWQRAPLFECARNVAIRQSDVQLMMGETFDADLENPAMPGRVRAHTLEDIRIEHHEIFREQHEALGVKRMRDVYVAAPLHFTIDDHKILVIFAGATMSGESPSRATSTPSGRRCSPTRCPA